VAGGLAAVLVVGASIAAYAVTAKTAVTPAVAAAVTSSAAAPATTAAAPSPTPPVEQLLAMGRTATPDPQASATVYAYKQPVARSATRPEQAGYTWGAADVKVCASKEPVGNQAGISVSHGPWVLAYADSTEAEPSSVGYQQFPLPEYPWGDHDLAWGRCVRGWIVFPVPSDKRPAAVEYRPQDDPVTDWKV
jgi:hypothetical protein